MLNSVFGRHLLGSRIVYSNILQSVRFYSSEFDFDKLVKNSKVVVFMKGVPNAPRCGFSNAVVQILRMHGVTYDSHDVLQNENMREGKNTFVSKVFYHCSLYSYSK